MKVTVNQDNTIHLEEVFNPIVLKTKDGEEMAICMRDSGFEFKYQGEWYFAKEGYVEPFHKSVCGNYKAGKRGNPETMQVEDKCFSHIPEDENKVIDFREINKVLTRIKEVYQLEDIDVGSRRWRQVEARAIWTYYLIKIGRIRHADAAKIVGRKRSMMYHYVKLVEDLYETNIPFRERFNRIGIPWRS